MPIREFNFSMLSSFTFSCIDCALDRAEEAIRTIASRNAGKYALDSGNFDVNEVFSIRNDSIGLKSRASSYMAVLFQPFESSQTIVISNLSDGWITLCNSIAVELKTFLYTFSFSDESEADARNALQYTDFSTNNKVSRVVYAMRDPRWVFYEEGAALYFEDVENYKNRIIKKRLNKRILISYCEELGYEIMTPGFFIPSGRVLRLQYTW